MSNASDISLVAMAATETVQIEMPAMGESVTEGTVLEWLKEEGDYVEEGETIVEVSTDKVDAEVPAPANGTLTKILKAPDDVVKVGEALAEFEPGGDGAPTSMDDRAAARATPTSATTPLPKQLRRRRPSGEDADAAAEPIELVMPEMGESVTEGTVLEWLKQAGDAVEEGETIVEVSTDKVDAEVPSPVAGHGRSRRSSSPTTWSRSASRWRGSSPVRRRGRAGDGLGGRRQPRRRGQRRRARRTATPRPPRSPAGSPLPRGSTSRASRARAPAAG